MTRPHARARQPFAIAPPREHAACGVGLLAARDDLARHEHLERGLAALAAVEHRGAVAADGRTSDGAGVMTDIPWALLERDAGSVAVASLFLLPATSRTTGLSRDQLLDVLEQTFAVFELELLDYRRVPTHPQVLGEIARARMPEILQAVIARPRHCRTEASFEARLYQAKQTTRTRIKELAGPHARERLFFTSLSSRTIVYKALTRAQDLPAFYPDLLNPRFRTRFVLFHRRFSTNTRSSWDKAQPFRLVAHNGEINTIAGNRSWSYSREQALGLAPNELLTHRNVSDSGNLNEQVEALRVRSSIPQIEDILAITMPRAGMRNEFYSFWGRAMEPWDGPALIAWADGRAVGARLDRNGFRPARWAMTEDCFVLASEAGIFGLDPAEILAQGSLGAGSGVKVDLDEGEVHFRDPSRSRENDGAHFDARLAPMPHDLPEAEPEPHLEHQALFGLTQEELSKVLVPMIAAGKEAIGSMGDTARPALFSSQPRSFYDFFFQTFAQVTNPPLDYLRERMVTDLSTYLGKRPNIFTAKELLPQTPGLRLDSPVLSLAQMAFIRRLDERTPRTRRPAELRLRAREIDICLSPSQARRAASEGGTVLAEALRAIAAQTLAAAEEGRAVVILSDRAASLARPPIPSLLALRAAVVALNREGLRLETSLVLDTGDVRTTHQLACAIGFGATAVCPYLACELARWSEAKALAGLDPDTRERNLCLALQRGLLKVMSKMGISVVRSYQSAKLFTCLGLSQRLLERYFPGLDSPIGGLGLAEIAADLLRTRDAAREAGEGPLPSSFLFKEQPRGRSGELHAMTAARSKLVHRLTQLREDGLREDGLAKGEQDSPANADARRQLWSDYVEAGEAAAPVHIRELLELSSSHRPLPLAQVQPRAQILATFGAGAMSFGAISAESQRDIIVAMRRIGGRSNSGEGGENPWYFVDGTTAATKQVASGRFGVDAEYLVTGDELEIKIAQGAKPGEGGQLMGVKVDEHIARARHATPGVDLISPPPLHDIYSIEDLKQLIFELRTVNPRARVCVKLVSGINIGTIAVGVAKAGADVIQISGGDGGTGAAPLSSMKHAGLPWELGLAEVHQALLVNGLRERVSLRVDGGLHSGFDILVATALGGEQFNFGKLLLVAEGCIMARICEKNRCPRGIATHDPKFKAKYVGSPDAVVEVLETLADEVRERLAALGLPDLRALLGRSEYLRSARAHRELLLRRGIDLSALLEGPGAVMGERVANDDRPDLQRGPGELERRILADVWPSLERGRPIARSYTITTGDRACLAGLAGRLAERAHRERMRSLAERPRDFDDPDRSCYLPAPRSVRLQFEGSAGQGFACFLVQGLDVRLSGEANDAVAKGMSGGRVTIVADDRAGFVPEDNTLIGNGALYGATGGQLFVRGRAGDRFAVRNSGAVAVVEGAGLHACEYMTGGTVAILGPIAANAGAGMTGGTLYLRRSELRRINEEYLGVTELDDEAANELRRLLERHSERTDSSTARSLLADWDQAKHGFCRLLPRSLVDEALQATGSENVLPLRG